MTTKIESRRRVGGFTLVEALVALLALSIGLLGVAGMQMTALRSNMSSAWRSQATYLAYDIIDRIRANHDNSMNYIADYGAAPGAPNPAGLDLAGWKANLAATLPLGDGRVEVTAVPGPLPARQFIVKVFVRWDDSRGENPWLIFETESRL